MTRSRESSPSVSIQLLSRETRIKTWAEANRTYAEITLVLSISESFAKQSVSNAPRSNVHLTPRETEVMTLVARGDAYAQVAHTLSISEDMAKLHIEKARRKLGARNRTHAAVMAVTQKLVQF